MPSGPSALRSPIICLIGAFGPYSSAYLSAATQPPIALTSHWWPTATACSSVSPWRAPLVTRRTQGTTSPSYSSLYSRGFAPPYYSSLRLEGGRASGEAPKGPHQSQRLADFVSSLRSSALEAYGLSVLRTILFVAPLLTRNYEAYGLFVARSSLRDSLLRSVEL